MTPVVTLRQARSHIFGQGDAGAVEWVADALHQQRLVALADVREAGGAPAATASLGVRGRLRGTRSGHAPSIARRPRRPSARQREAEQAEAEIGVFVMSSRLVFRLIARQKRAELLDSVIGKGIG